MTNMNQIVRISLFCHKFLGFTPSNTKPPGRLYCILPAIAFIFTLLSCSPTPIALAAPLPDDPAKALWWLPSDITFVNHQGAGQIALIMATRQILNDRLAVFDNFPKKLRPRVAPIMAQRQIHQKDLEHFNRLANQVDHLFMLSRFLGDKPLIAVHGFTDRIAVEDGIARVYQDIWGRPVTLQRYGAITQASAGGGAEYLGWSDDGWLYVSKDRSRVESFLKRPSNPTISLPPSLLKRVSLDQKLWTVFAGDATGRFFGVPSTGFIQECSPPKTKSWPMTSGMPITFIFKSASEAQRASEAFTAFAKNENSPQPLRLALSAMKPEVRGNEVNTDCAPLLTDVDAMKAAISVMMRMQK